MITKELATELDVRFSDPGTQPTPWDRTPGGARIRPAGLGVDGPRRRATACHPLVAVWLDGAFHFCTGADEQKGVNLATNPHVVLTTGGNRWEQGLDVMVEGEARRVTDRTTLRRLADAWATKWDGTWQFDVAGDGFHHRTPVETPSSPRAGTLALVFAVEPTKILTFGKGSGNFTHTRYLPADR